MTTPQYDAILFASFGGPEGQEDVIPFLRNVTAGRGVPDERLEEVAGHYRALGGRSPINAQNRELIAALQEELASRDVHLPIYFGNRNWAPYTAEALQSLHADGHRRALALITSAYSSYSGCRQYREDFARRLDETGLLGELAIEKSRSYFNHPGFLAPVVDGVAAALRELDREGHDADRVRVLFSTHSMPLAMNDASGPTGEGNWYVDQHLAACRYVMEHLHDDLPVLPGWELVYQSRSGSPHVPWLEPDVNDVIARVAAEDQADAVIVVPIGFVTDHVEGIWELDTEARETAQAQPPALLRLARALAGAGRQRRHRAGRGGGPGRCGDRGADRLRHRPRRGDLGPGHRGEGDRPRAAARLPPGRDLGHRSPLRGRARGHRAGASGPLAGADRGHRARRRGRRLRPQLLPGQRRP